MNKEEKKIATLVYLLDNLETEEKAYKFIEYINNLENENIELKGKLLEKMCSDKDVEYQEKIKLQKRIDKATEIAKDLKQFVYDELVDRCVSGATETHCKIIDLLETLTGGNNDL